MKKFRILKVVGLVLLTMSTLVTLSFLEVAIYSMVIEKGQDQTFYEAHARLTAPWVSGIGGFVIFFLVVRYWAKRSFQDLKVLTVLYPTAYVLIDLTILLISAEVEWESFIITFLLANGAKFIGSLSAYTLYRIR